MTHPSAVGLQYCFALNEGAGVPYDAMRAAAPAASAGLAWGGGPAGMTLSFNGTSSYAKNTLGPWSPAPPLTLAAWAQSATTGPGYILALASTTDFNSIACLAWGQLLTGKPSIYWRNTAAAAAYCSSASTYNDGKWHFLVGVIPPAGGACSIYVDGLPAGATPTGTVATAASFNNVSLGAIVRSAISYGASTTGFAAAWSRALGAAEIASLYAQPWQLFAPGPLRSWVFFQGSGALAGSSSGGVIVGGSAAPSVAYSPAASGGAIAGGTASPSALYSPVAAGGPAAGGLASPSSISTPAALGGPVAGGSAAGSIPGATTGLGYRAWPQKPPRGTPIDAAAPLSRGLAALWALQEGAGVPFDLASRAAASSNLATWAGTPYGMGLNFNGTSQYVNLGSSPAWSITGPLTVAFLANPAASTLQDCVELRASTNSGGYSGIITSTGQIQLTVASAMTPVSTQSTAGAADGDWHLFAASMSATGAGGVQFYRDGQPWGTGSLSTFAAAYGSGFLGTNTTASGAWLKGSLAWAGVWARPLSAAEHQALAASPWRLFRRRMAFAQGGPATFVGGSTGGPIVGGTATPAAAYSPPASGGVVAGGSARGASNTVFTATASGGAVLGGSASPTARFTATASGGAIAGGTASPSVASSPPVSGGAVVGGMLSPSAIYVGAASGGAIAGGTARGSTPGTFTAIAAGGAIVGGSAAGSMAGGTLLVTATLRAIAIVTPSPASPWTIDPERTVAIVTPSPASPWTIDPERTQELPPSHGT